MRNIIRGWLGEKIATFGMWALLDQTIYHRVDNAIIPAPNGTTQIDHILVSQFGVFVIETKNLKGWIFGSPQSDKWTQNIYGKKFPFQNPIKQNFRHTKCLSEHLRLNHKFFHPVIFFAAECEFKTPTPPNVINEGLITYIKQFRDVCLTPLQVNEAISALLELKQNPNLTKSAHLQSLRDRHGSTTVCPRCGAALVERHSRTGNHFLGCSTYPKCKFTKDLLP